MGWPFDLLGNLPKGCCCGGPLEARSKLYQVVLGFTWFGLGPLWWWVKDLFFGKCTLIVILTTSHIWAEQILGITKLTWLTLPWGCFDILTHELKEQRREVSPVSFNSTMNSRASFGMGDFSHVLLHNAAWVSWLFVCGASLTPCIIRLRFTGSY